VWSIVRWATPSAAYQFIASTHTQQAYPSMDGHGDIAWLSGTNAYVRLANGTVRDLDNNSGSYQVGPGEDGAILGYNQDVVKWDMATIPGSGPVPYKSITPPNPSLYPAAVGTNGGMLMGGGPRPYFLTRGGAFVQAPAELAYSGYQAVDETGVLAYTSAQDYRVHLLRCSR